MKIGISSCLLGNNVRYNGGHTRDRYLTDILGAFVEWVPVCPEVECGLPVPRESMRLVGTIDDCRLMTAKTEIDHTDRMLSWAKKKISSLAKQDLCGFVFKSKSPSSGMRAINVYSPRGGQPTKRGIGLFAGAFMKAFPLVPVEDEGRLHDAGLRENFIERVFAFSRWKELVKGDPSLGEFMAFHADHKLLLMAHSPKLLKEMGALVSSTKKRALSKSLDEYISLFLETLKLQATVKKNTNVLQHGMGYFKKLITGEEKEELAKLIMDYHDKLVPLIVPIVLLRHYVKKYKVDYLQRQWYLYPHPKELMLRNHV